MDYILIGIFLIIIILSVFTRSVETFQDEINATQTNNLKNRFSSFFSKNTETAPNTPSSVNQQSPKFKSQPLSFIRSEVYGWIPIVDKANEIITQWIPNIGWVWKINDQIIDFQRARKGIPPMNKINPNSLNVSVQSKPTAFIWK